MHFLLRAVALLLVFGFSNCHAQGGLAGSSRGVTAFTNIHVITVTDSIPLKDQTVIVRGGEIVAIGPASTIDIPEGAMVIDGEHRKYLTPGLVDTHVHLHRPKAQEWVREFLSSGVTTVFNLKGNKKILALRRKAREGKIQAPDIYTSGPFAGAKTSWFDKTSPKALERLVLSQKRAGYDMVKIHGDLPLKSYERLMEFSRAQGMFVMGHIPRNLTFQDAINVRQLSLAHAEEMIYTQFSALDTTEIAPFAVQAGEMGMWLTPTLVAFDRLSNAWGDPGVMQAVLDLPATKELHPQIQKVYAQDWYGKRDPSARPFFQEANAFHRPLVLAMHGAGVQLMLGTDAPMPAVPPGISLHDDIDLMLKLGFSPYETLKMGTMNPGVYVATHIDEDAKFGQVMEGFRANLLLLSANPLEDMSVLRRPEGVMKGGMWYPRQELDAMTEW